MKQPTLIYILLIISLLSGACAQGPTKPVDPQYPGSAYSILTKNNLTVMVKPVTDSYESNKYFYTDLLDSDVIPIFVKIKNNDLTNRYVLQIEKCALSDNQANSSDQVSNTTKMSESLDSTIDVGSVLLFTPVLLTGIVMVQNEAAVESSILANQIKEQIIRPGNTSQGFLYFKADINSISSNEVTLHLAFIEIGQQEIVDFNFPFPTGGK